LVNFNFAGAVNSLVMGSDTLSNSTKSETSAHSIVFATKTILEVGDKIKLFFPDFTLALDSSENISTPNFDSTVSYSNSAKTIEIILTEDVSAGEIVIEIIAGKIINPAVEGEYSISILTLDSSNADATIDSGIAKAGVENEVRIVINIGATISNVTSSQDDGIYYIGNVIPILLTFTGSVFVTGIPEINLNNGGVAFYSSGSGTNTLVFNYEVQDSSEYTDDTELDYSLTDPLTLAGGTIKLSNNSDAILTLPEPGDTNSLGFNKNIFIENSGSRTTNPPIFLSFEIVDNNGVTSDRTPSLRFSAQNDAVRISLSCNGGGNWSDWISFPSDNEIDDFDILSCSLEKGVKTISARVANSRGEEAAILTDSTIYQESSTSESGSNLSNSVSEAGVVDEVSDEEITEDTVIEIGYFDQYAIWQRSITHPSISRIAAGSDFDDRAQFSSGEWINSAELTSDGTLSFSWSGVGENFYFVLDDNSFPTSLVEISDETRSTNNFFVDDIPIIEGENFFHLVAENSEGEKSEESVFVVNFDATPPRLTEIKKSGNKLKLIFSEKVTTNEETILYFADGEDLILPLQKKASAIIEIEADVSSEISLIIGMFVDRAGLVAINPHLPNLFANLRDTNLIFLFPTKIIDGKFFTQENLARVKPTATGATKLRLAADLLSSDDWQDFSENEIDVPLNFFGAQKILFEFSNESNEYEVAGAIVTRVPANSSEFTGMQQKQTETLASFREELATKIKSWFVWGLDPKFTELIDSINPAALKINFENLEHEKVDHLNQVLADAEKIRELASMPDPNFKKILALAEDLAEFDFSLADFLSFTEINSLLFNTDPKIAARLSATLDQNSVMVQVEDQVFFASALSLGMRDSDDDGLADLFEIEFGSDPFSADSDGDGLLDSAEIFDFGSDPLVSDFISKTNFIDIDEGAIFFDPRPLFAGVAAAGQILKITAVNSNGDEIFLGETITDERGSFKLLSQISLPADEYKLHLKSGSQILATRQIEINLNFIILPPQIFVSKNEIFEENRPAFFGNTFYRGRVVANFDGVSTAIVVDNSAGDFVIRPLQNLGAGRHSFTFFVELVDGTRSPVRSLDFEIVEQKLKFAAHKIDNLDSQKIVVGGGVLLTAGIFGIWIFRRRQN